jgi:glycosyltransferase involved in cell wall biosynthesis
VRIVLVTTRPLAPAWRGNQLRTVQIADWLASEHEVTVLSPDATTAGGSDAWTVIRYRRTRRDSLTGIIAAIARGWPLQNGLYRSRDLARRLADLASRSDLVIAQMVRLEPVLRAVGATPLLVDFVDCMSLNLERRAAIEPFRRRTVFAIEARRVAAAESRLLGSASGAWVVCDRDRRHLARLRPAPPTLSVLPIGVAAGNASARVSRPDAPVLAITGNLGYFPTNEGALWFLREVWPAVRVRLPRAVAVIAGSRPTRALRRACASAGVELLERPADLAAPLLRASVAAAPLRAGSGVPIKVLEAWAAGVPVVATSYAAAGTTAVPGRDLLVADDAGGWVDSIVRLHTEPGLGERLAAAGRARLAADYDPTILRLRALEAVAAASAPGARSPRAGQPSR